MTMKIKDFYEMCRQGKTPLIKMKDNIHDYLEESFDPQMIGRVINVSIEYEDSYRLLIDLNGHEEYNKSIALYDWKDDKGELTKSWFDTPYYPEDGIDSAYFPMDIDIPFEVISENSIFSRYLESKEGESYIDWLENRVKDLEEEANSTTQTEDFNQREKVDISHKVQTVTIPVSYGGRLPVGKER